MQNVLSGVWSSSPNRIPPHCCRCNGVRTEIISTVLLKFRASSGWRQLGATSGAAGHLRGPRGWLCVKKRIQSGGLSL
jgi:hypothetical protein